MREQGGPEKYVRLVKDTYEDARTQVKKSIGLTGKITVIVGLHQGSSLSPYLFDMILDVMGRGIKEQPPGVCCLQTISCCAALEETMYKGSLRNEEQWKSEDLRSVEGRPNNWGAMNINMQRSSYR